MASNRAPVAVVHEAIACLGHLTDAFQRRREQLAASVGLSDGQWGVLEEIAREHFMPSMFAKTRESSAAAVSKTLRQLLDKELISVTLSKADGRQRAYVLSAKGKRLLESLRREREQAIERIWLPLDRERLQNFASFAKHLTLRLEQYGSNPKDM